MQTIGEVVAVNGNVRAVSGGEEHALTQGSPIHLGETILTAQGGSVEIKLADDSILAQGENASQTIDSFIFDPANASASSMLVNMAQGTFRMVTGQVGKANPEGIAVKTPLATIGIRGTGIDLDIQGAIAKVGCFLYDGLDVTISTEQGTRFLNAVNTILDILADGTFGEIRSYSDFEKAFFSAAVPILGLPEGDFYGEGDTGDGEDDNESDGQDQGDGTHGDNADLAQLFAAIFGTGEQPNQTMQELFQALIGDGDRTGDPLGGGVTGDTLGDVDDEDPSDTVPGTTTGEDAPDATLHSTVTDGDDDGSLWDTSGIDPSYIFNGTSGEDPLLGNSDNAYDELFRGYGGDDSIEGRLGNDSLFGGAGDDFLDGSDGNDLLVGGTGDDTLYGSFGNDTLWGGSGSDTLFGGEGSDSLIGGTGADIFKYTAKSDGGEGGATGDSITDFQHGEDYFEFTLTVFTPCTTFADGTGTHPQNSPGFWTWGSDYQYGFDGGGNTGDKGFIFDSDGDLWYDPDLGVNNNAVHIAHVEGDHVTNTDINLV